MSNQETHPKSEEFVEFSEPYEYNQPYDDQEYSQPYQYDASSQYDFTQTYDDSQHETHTDYNNHSDHEYQPASKKIKPNFAVSSAAVAYSHVEPAPALEPQQPVQQQLLFDTMGAVPYPQGYTQSSASVDIQLEDYSQKDIRVQREQKEEVATEKKEGQRIIRAGGGQIWEDKTLGDWSSTDFRIFVGDLGRDVSDDALTRAFSKYPSLLKARIVRDRKTLRTKGYGFVSFGVVGDFIKALKEMDGKFVGSRPIKLRKSTWEDRNISVGELKVLNK